MGHNTEDRGCLQDTEPNKLFDTIKTRGEDYELHSSPLPNGNISGPHPSSKLSSKGNPLHNQRWISQKTSGGTSCGNQKGATRPRTVGAFQAATLQRRADKMLQVSEVRAPQGQMPQPGVLCHLQRQTRDQCLYQKTQGGTKHNSMLHQLQREPPCVEPQMPRMSETDSNRTMPGHNNTANQGEGSHTKEASHFCYCPLNHRIKKNRLPCKNTERSPEMNPHSKDPKGEETAKGKKTFQDCRTSNKLCCRGKHLQGKEGPGTSRKVDGEAQSGGGTKSQTKMVSAQIQTSPVSAPAKETQIPRRERKESETQTPATTKDGSYSLSGQQIIIMMQTFATALVVQLNITLQTEQVKKTTGTTLNAPKFLTRTSKKMMRRRNKMSINLDAGMNTSMEIKNP